jgi:hypothetical protein
MLTLLSKKKLPTHRDRTCTFTMPVSPEDEEVTDAPGSDSFFLTMPLVLKPEDEEPPT